MRREGALQQLRPLLRRIRNAVVPKGTTFANSRLAFRNALVTTILMLCIWIPVLGTQVWWSQSRLLSRLATDAGHQSAEVGKSLFQAHLLLQELARELGEVSQLGDGDRLSPSISSNVLDRPFGLNPDSCSGYTLIHNGVFVFSSKYSRPPSGTLPDGTPLNLRSLPGSDSVNGEDIPAFIGPLRSRNGTISVLLTATFRWKGKDPSFGVLVAEYDLGKLLREHPLLTTEVDVLQEICREDGTHLWGATGLRQQYPVGVELVVPGENWEMLIVPSNGWFRLSFKDLSLFGGLGLLMLGGSTFSVWRLTLAYGALITELREKSVALQVANRRMQEDYEKVETAQRKLAVSELRTRLIYEQMPVGVGLLEAETGRFLAVNPEACRILAAAESELLPRRLQDLLSLSDTTADTAAEPAQATIGTLSPGEYFVRDGLGGLRRVQLTLAPIVRQPGERDRRLAVMQDVTEGWQAQEELRKHEERVRVLADTLPGPLVFIDADERCQFANAASHALLAKINGSSVDSPLGRKTADILPPVIYEFLKPWIERALQGDATQFETTAEIEQLGFGAWTFFHRPLRHEGQIVGFFAFLLEISQQRSDERQRRELDSRLAEAHRMETVGTLAGGVAHEFNNMLQVVLGFADVLLIHCEKDLFAVENLNHIRHAGRRAADLTRQLLAFARIQPGTPAQINFADFVPASLKLLRHAGGDEMQLNWSSEGPLDDVLIDPSHLELILANLIINARHAMDGRGVIEVRARNLPASAAAEQGLPVAGQPSVLLSVCDTGCGMTPEVQARMFDPFFTTRAVGKGTGLGLPTVYGLATQAGGRIDVRSEPGRGTTIHILFPSRDSNTTPPPHTQLNR
jgi:PAS domain S-box-containing protein